MKIAVIHSIYKPDTRGGAEVAVENIASGLKERGEDVFVIAVGRSDIINSNSSLVVIPAKAGIQEKKNDLIQISLDSRFRGNDKEKSENWLKIYRVKPFNLFNFLDINKKLAWLRLPWHIIDMFNAPQAWRIYKILKKEKPDLVLTHNLKGLGYLTPWIIRFLKIKNIHTVHDMQLLHPSGLLDVETPRWGISMVALYRFFCKKLFDSPAVVIFPSEHIKSVYKKFGFFKDSKKLVIGNPIKIPNSRFQDTKKPQFPISNFQFLYLGQVERYKGIFELLDALRGLEGDWTLNVVGEGKAMPEAKIRAQKAFPEGNFVAQNGPKIRFWGRLGQDELEEKIWPITDLLVNPSQTAESFGMVMIEAFAHGVPALVSGKGALPELVREGETGFICRDAPAGRLYADLLRDKIFYCLAHRADLAKMRENCFKESEKYNIENYLNKLMEFGKMSMNNK